MRDSLAASTCSPACWRSLHETFAVWQVIGGLAWSLGITVAGYTLGSTIPGVDQYLLPAVALIVIVSVIPIALELRRSRRGRGWHAGWGHTAAQGGDPR